MQKRINRKEQDFYHSLALLCSLLICIWKFFQDYLIKNKVEDPQLLSPFYDNFKSFFSLN